MGYSNITYERFESVARVTLTRSESGNAQSEALLKELDHAMGTASADPEVHVIILGGAGDHFSAGHDLKEAKRERQNLGVEDRWAFEKNCYFDLCIRILNLPKPTIAQVQGACVAAGFMLANMCGLIVASEDAYFADPVVHSIGAAAVEVLIHPWVLGTRKAKEFLFTGEKIGASEAREIGLINRLVSRPDLDAETMALAQNIASAPPFAVSLVKRSLNRAWDLSGLRASLEAHFDTHELSHYTNEMQTKIQKGFDATIKDAKAMA